MPFVTEELWWKLRPRDDRRGTHRLRRGPRPTAAETDAEAAALFATVQDLVGAVRQVRAQYNVPPSQASGGDVSVGGDDAEATALALESVRGYIERLAGWTTS